MSGEESTTPALRRVGDWLCWENGSVHYALRASTMVRLEECPGDNWTRVRCNGPQSYELGWSVPAKIDEVLALLAAPSEGASDSVTSAEHWRDKCRQIEAQLDATVAAMRAAEDERDKLRAERDLLAQGAASLRVAPVETLSTAKPIKFHRGTPILTPEDCAQMDCPLPPESPEGYEDTIDAWRNYATRWEGWAIPEIKRLRAENAKLRARVEDPESPTVRFIVSQEESRASWQARAEKAEARVAELERERDKLRAQMVELGAEKSSLALDVAILHYWLDKEKTQVQGLKGAEAWRRLSDRVVSPTLEELAECRSERDTLRARVAELESENARLEKCVGTFTEDDLVKEADVMGELATLRALVAPARSLVEMVQLFHLGPAWPHGSVEASNVYFGAEALRAALEAIGKEDTDAQG